jgi:adenylate cyclase
LLYVFEDFTLDIDRRELRREGALTAVEPQVFDLLAHLICNRERVISKDDLLAAVWKGRIVSEATLDSRINAARRAIRDSGEQQRLIKTVPRKGVRFVGTVQLIHQSEDPAADARPASTASRVPDRATDELQQGPLPHHPGSNARLLDRPSIAVLPFANLSADPEQDYFSDGITEDIITELSRFFELLVIARNSSFQYKGKAVDIRQVGRELGVRYVLEGSVRRSGDRIRITAQLVDAITGAHRWAERYDRELHDVFAIQDELARAIVTILALHVNRAETERALLKPPADLKAYDFYLRGAETFMLHLINRTKPSLSDAQALLEQCLAVDPDYARAYAMLAWTHAISYFQPLDRGYHLAAALDRALELAKTAVRLDARLPQAHAQLGHVLFLKGQHDAAIAEWERAFALNPNFLDFRYGFGLLFLGEPAKAIEVVEANLRLDPRPIPAYSYGLMGIANYMIKRYPDAVRLLRDCKSRGPNPTVVHLVLASAYAQLGQLEEARAEIAEVLRIDPDFTVAKSKQTYLYFFKNPSDAEHNIDGLRKAGLPET